MKKNIFYAILFCGATAGLIGWRVHAVRTQEVPHFEIIEDLSLSHPEGCEPLLGLAERVLRMEGVSAGSTLSVLVIGNETTANEPWQLGRYLIPTTRKVLEGPTATLQRRQGVLHDISQKCRALPRTTISPIFLGVKQAVADLRAQGCTEISHCQIFIDSDLQENVEFSIRANIEAADRQKLSSLPQINNKGIHVTFCGLAVTSGDIAHGLSRRAHELVPRSAGHEDRLQDIWRSVFSNDGMVGFEPFCPKLAGEPKSQPTLD
jgi:hypothetical protein